MQTPFTTRFVYDQAVPSIYDAALRFHEIINEDEFKARGPAITAAFTATVMKWLQKTFHEEDDDEPTPSFDFEKTFNEQDLGGASSPVLGAAANFLFRTMGMQGFRSEEPFQVVLAALTEGFSEAGGPAFSEAFRAKLAPLKCHDKMDAALKLYQAINDSLIATAGESKDDATACANKIIDAVMEVSKNTECFKKADGFTELFAAKDIGVAHSSSLDDAAQEFWNGMMNKTLATEGAEQLWEALFREACQAAGESDFSAVFLAKLASPQETADALGF